MRGPGGFTNPRPAYRDDPHGRNASTETTAATEPEAKPRKKAKKNLKKKVKMKAAKRR